MYMEEWLRFKYYQEIFAVLFVGLIIVVLALIYFIWIITDKIKDKIRENKSLKRRKRR